MEQSMSGDWTKLFGARTAAWFREEIGAPTPVQAEGWPVIAGGGSALIAAPTGTGKTLTAFLWYIDKLAARAESGALENKTYLLYLSPLKALGNDIERNLERPLRGVEARMRRDGLEPMPITVGVRNGDTTASERRAMLRKPPHILITTPESLFVLLSTVSGRALLGGIEAVIVDEMHALIDTKRGAHMMASLERLNALVGRDIPRVGLSATIAPLALAANWLAGYGADGAPRPVNVVSPAIRKAVDLEVVVPVPDLRALPEGSIWPEIFRRVYEAAAPLRTTLVFCEGRATCEKMAHGVNLLAGEGFARTHHGCVSKEQRLEAERALKDGRLRMLCATSSMELGIDIGEIDLVVQIGAPGSIARALQRLGRAGHRPDVTSVMRFYPREGGDLMRAAFIARGALAGKIEPARPIALCLDVLAQQLVSMAVETRYTVDEALGIMRGAYCFRALTKAQVEAVLRMLAGDFEHEADMPVRPRVEYDRIAGTVTGAPGSRMLALLSGGTIPDRGWYAVVLEDGTRLGELDEEFVFEARLGDRFLLGAFAWQIQRIERDRVVVRACDPAGVQSPFWRGDETGRPFETGLLFGSYLRELETAALTDNLIDAAAKFALSPDAALNMARRVREQMDVLGALPTDRALVLEHFTDEAGEAQLLVHSVFGSRVNLPLGLLLEEIVKKETGAFVRMHYSDDGILLYRTGGEPLSFGLMARVSPEGARARVAALLPASPLFSMAFRYNAARALMMGVRKGGRQPLWVQRLRGAEAFERATHAPEHPLLIETLRSCMEDYTDIGALIKVLEGVESGTIAVAEARSAYPSPMARQLRRRFEAEEMYDYTPAVGVTSLAIPDLSMEQKPVADADALQQAAGETPAPRNADDLHALLMIEGDLVPGEADAPVDWLEALAARGRARYIEPGLWICAEQAELYEDALIAEDAEARARIARRCLRYRGPLDAAFLTARYGWARAVSEALLAALERDGLAVPCEAGFAHRDVYGKALRLTVARKRRIVETAPASRYAALLADQARLVGAPDDRLARTVARYRNFPLAAALWEDTVLPMRVPGYRPDMLDQLLASGAAAWRLLPENRPQICFHAIADEDWDVDPQALIADLPLEEDERRAFLLLMRRGASFASALFPQALPALMKLAARGLVRCDAFTPVRALLTADGDASPKRRAARSAKLAVSGRWEIARPLIPRSIDQMLDAAFDRFLIVDREVARIEGMPWPEALARLRVLEYTARVRRGYFVEGMSGAQFVREADYPRVTAALARTAGEAVVLPACDPCQAWGLLLTAEPERAFLRVPGTALVLVHGEIALIAERQGRRLRVIDEARLQEALAAFARAFLEKRVYPELTALCVKEYPKSAASALENAGFGREMLDYALWRGH